MYLYLEDFVKRALIECCSIAFSQRVFDVNRVLIRGVSGSEHPHC